MEIEVIRPLFRKYGIEDVLIKINEYLLYYTNDKVYIEELTCNGTKISLRFDFIDSFTLGKYRWLKESFLKYIYDNYHKIYTYNKIYINKLKNQYFDTYLTFETKFGNRNGIHILVLYVHYGLHNDHENYESNGQKFNVLEHYKDLIEKFYNKTIENNNDKRYLGIYHYQSLVIENSHRSEVS